MKTVFHITRMMMLLCCLCFSAQAAKYQQIQWIDLLPEEDLQALTEAPIPDSILEGSAADKINSPLSMTIKDPVSDYERALVSVRVKNEFNKRKIKLPGYIVPIETTEDGRATSFFLVPFFGACIHLPPPPPNQIIYATYEKGIKMDDLEIPFWIEGTVFTKKKMNDLALAAYSATVDRLYEFKDTDKY